MAAYWAAPFNARHHRNHRGRLQPGGVVNLLQERTAQVKQIWESWPNLRHHDRLATDPSDMQGNQSESVAKSRRTRDAVPPNRCEANEKAAANLRFPRCACTREPEKTRKLGDFLFEGSSL